MKLSLVFELLLIFVLLAFAASKSVKRRNNKKGLQKNTEAIVDNAEDNTINRYCKCAEAYCNCCRDFAVPLINLNGPGCATVTYLSGDKMAVSLKFGNKVITNRTLSSKKPSPVCMPLPGGVSKFCGRVYNIARTGEDFRACLGLELQSRNAVEAAVRVSCFKFGARGVTSEPADPLPLVPDEKGDEDEDDDDDDDDDDDYGLGADDDEEESELDAVNDVEGADYTGFSLLGEDILGDLFSTGGKKPNKNKPISKKQAPTTTTKRPRTTRRPSRRPSTRTTTPRPARTTTVRVRPSRRPSRRPTRRPGHTTRKPTTVQDVSLSVLTSAATQATPVASPVTFQTSSTAEQQMTSLSDETFEPIIGNRIQSTTAKSVANLEDPGLQMSLAHITGQLSSMPVIPISSDNIAKGSSKVEKEMEYEKVQIITPKAPPASEEKDDMIQIVQTLDSSEENVPVKETMNAEESRAYYKQFGSIGGGSYEGLRLPRRDENDGFQLEDLDILDLTNIGETIGEQIGIFGTKKRKNRHTEEKEPDYSDYHDVVDTMGDALLMARNNNGNKVKKDRRRQNKMMRGEWSQV